MSSGGQMGSKPVYHKARRYTSVERMSMLAHRCGYRDWMTMVSHLVRCGWSRTRIAHTMGVSLATLSNLVSVAAPNLSRIQLIAMAAQLRTVKV